MRQIRLTEGFEEVLLSYTEMCYSVAFALTHNPDQARDLTQDVLTWAWHLRNSPNAKTAIKGKLLRNLRERFLNDYRMSRRTA